METFSMFLALCAGNSPVSDEFPTQRPVTRSFDVFYDLRPNKRLSKQSWGWWFEMLSSPLLRHCNVFADDGYVLFITLLYLEQISMFKDGITVTHREHHNLSITCVFLSKQLVKNLIYPKVVVCSGGRMWVFFLNVQTFLNTYSSCFAKSHAFKHGWFGFI